MRSNVRSVLTLSGARNDLDARHFVTLFAEELPWPIKFGFLRDDAGVWRNVSFEMGVGPVPRSAFADAGVVELEEITASAVRWLQENFFHYRAIAESHFNTDRVIPSRSGSRVTPEALALIAAQYRELDGQRGAIDHLARVHNVNRTTIWRWLKRAGVDDNTKTEEQS